MKRDNMFSSDRQHRVKLWREMDPANSAFALFIGLNPSTATEREDDPTLRRCMSFAQSFGCGSLLMMNLFTIRSPEPAVMKAHPMPCVPGANDFCLREAAAEAHIIIAAWGAHGGHRGRDVEVYRMLTETVGRKLYCLGVTKEGYPRHPLYVKGGTIPQPYPGRV